jgi:hypothetical protein
MKFETLEVGGIAPALHGMRNPKNSWDKADTTQVLLKEGGATIGPRDLTLAQILITGGPVHSKFLRQIQVWVDIEAPLYWWAEFDTYKVGVTRDSCSTMHKLLDTVKKVTPDQTELVLELFETQTDLEKETILFVYQNIYKIAADETLSADEKIVSMKRLLPDGYIQRATISMSYQNIRAMIKDRHCHRLQVWNRDFIEWAKTLPYAGELLFYKNGEDC